MPDGPDMDVFLELGRELLVVLAKNIHVKMLNVMHLALVN